MKKNDQNAQEEIVAESVAENPGPEVVQADPEWAERYNTCIATEQQDVSTHALLAFNRAELVERLEELDQDIARVAKKRKKNAEEARNIFELLREKAKLDSAKSYEYVPQYKAFIESQQGF
jgi:hypothetical protein